MVISCNGAFTIKSIEEGKKIVYTANANYWRGKPKLDRVEATYITDEVQRFEAYKKGEFDEVDVTSGNIGASGRRSETQSGNVTLHCRYHH